MKKHQHLELCPSTPVPLLFWGESTNGGTNGGTFSGTNRSKSATIKARWKVRTTIVSTTCQKSKAMRIIIAISFPIITLIRAGTTTPSTRSTITSRSYNHNVGQVGLVLIPFTNRTDSWKTQFMAPQLAALASAPIMCYRNNIT